MQTDKKLAALKLLESFGQFRKLHIHRESVCGLRPGEIGVMFYIKEHSGCGTDGIKVSELSNSMKVAPPSITQMINGLEDNGYVKRNPDKEDRRVIRIKLTEKGENVIKKAMENLLNVVDGLVEYLGEEKSNELTEILSSVFIYFNNIKK